jgi:polysaccharide export outer membrane protein
MKVFCAMLAVMLLAIPVAGIAQGSQTPSAPTAAAVPGKPAGAATEGQQTAPAGQTTPATGTPTQALAMVNTDRYVIGADDSLNVMVWREPTLSGAFPVRPDGMISLVLVGDLPAAGKTPMQLAADIAQGLKKYIQDPVVTVAVLAVNSQKVFMIGEVGHVGPIMLTPGMTPLQAISAAGGLTMFANSKHIYILRGTGLKQQKIPFNYKQALKGDSKKDVSLQPGDTIVVP